MKPVDPDNEAKTSVFTMSRLENRVGRFTSGIYEPSLYEVNKNVSVYNLEIIESGREKFDFENVFQFIVITIIFFEHQVALGFI